jgi:hypothetical protein
MYNNCIGRNMVRHRFFRAECILPQWSLMFWQNKAVYLQRIFSSPFTTFQHKVLSLRNPDWNLFRKIFKSFNLVKMMVYSKFFVFASLINPKTAFDLQ